MIEQAQTSKQLKEFVSDENAAPEAAAYWLERGDRLGRLLLAMSAAVSRLWGRSLHMPSRTAGPHSP